MFAWSEFCSAAPLISTIFERRHAATGQLCLLGTIRADGSPRVSPMEPVLFEDALWIVGMPHTRKFDDLASDPRFCLHTATVDTMVGDGDAKLFGTVTDVGDLELQRRFADDLFERTGFDIRGETFDHFYRADITSASAVEVIDDHMDVHIWKAGEQERTVRKH